MSRGIDIVLSRLSTKRNFLAKGGNLDDNEEFLKRVEISGGLLSIICHQGSCGRYMISTLSICATIVPRRHNLCISFSLLLIFLHRHQAKQCQGCRREKINCKASASLEATLGGFWGLLSQRRCHSCGNCD